MLLESAITSKVISSCVTTGDVSQWQNDYRHLHVGLNVLNPVSQEQTRDLRFACRRYYTTGAHVPSGANTMASERNGQRES